MAQSLVRSPADWFPATWRHSLIAALAAGTCCVGSAWAEGWPQWRGPSFDGISTADDLPTNWGPEQNVRWRLELPGPAASTPAVWGESIYLTSTDSDSEALWVLAVGTDGVEQWRREVVKGKIKVPGRFDIETNAASPSPVTDGRSLWVLFGTGDLASLDLDGKVRWQRNLSEDYGKPELYFGLSSSPLLHEGRLYFQMLHGGQQLILALDAANGKELWQVERETDATAECLHAYTTPVIYQPAGGMAQLLIHGADYTTAHNLADGKELWRHGNLNPKDNYNPSLRLVATPVVADGLIVVPSAKRGPVHALRPGSSARGTLATQGKAWTLERGTPDVPSPLVYGGLVYLNGENGRLTVIDAESGETLYAERVHQSTHRASPVLADGKLLLTATDGTVSVLRPGREYEVLAKNELGERLAASPAVVGDTIYLRSYEALWAIGTVADKAPSEGASSPAATESE